MKYLKHLKKKAYQSNNGVTQFFWTLYAKTNIYPRYATDTIYQRQQKPYTPTSQANHSSNPADAQTAHQYR